ncbi:hypothetical protein FRB98_006137 [Tulasnella sp. 332]|nr:hypothetical protein FRB98_006137 [Tulasnella sp. 332]
MSTYASRGAGLAHSSSFNGANNLPAQSQSARHQLHDFHQYFPRDPSIGLQRNISIPSQSSPAYFNTRLDDWIVAERLRTPSIASFGTPTQSTFPPPMAMPPIDPPTPLAGRGQYPALLLGDSGSSSATERWKAAIQRPEAHQVGLPTWPSSRQASVIITQFDLAGIQVMCQSLFRADTDDERDDEEFQKMVEEEQAAELSLLQDAARTAGEDSYLWNAPHSAAFSVSSFTSSACPTENGQDTPQATPYVGGFEAPSCLPGSIANQKSPILSGHSLLAAYSPIGAGHSVGSSRTPTPPHLGSQYLHAPEGSASHVALRRSSSPCTPHEPVFTDDPAAETGFMCRWKDPFSSAKCDHRSSRGSLLAHHLREVHGRQELLYLSERRLRQNECSALILSTVFKLHRENRTGVIGRILQIQVVLILQTMSSAQHVDLSELAEFVEELSKTGHELESQPSP